MNPVVNVAKKYACARVKMEAWLKTTKELDPQKWDEFLELIRRNGIKREV